MKILLSLLMVCHLSYGQEEHLIGIIEDQAGMEDVKEVEEDIHELRKFSIRPLNINKATAEDLQFFPFLSPLHIEQFILYRKYAGPLIDVKELQAVPGWDVTTIRKLIPYVTIFEPVDFRETVSESWKKAKHQILLRSSLSKNAPMLSRYHFSSPQIEFGVNTEKDAGERFWQGSKGPSFISAHAMIRNIGRLKMLILGDYIVNLGQGLTVWQGRAVKKSALPIMVKRQLPLFMPYRSNDENRYFRGAAAFFQHRKVEFGTFVSLNGLDANTDADSVSRSSFVTSFLTTGYHRTTSELEDKNAVRLLSTGAIVAFQYKQLRVAANAVFHHFSLPVKRADKFYNRFAAKGNTLFNQSVNYHYTQRNMHVFGELALDREGDMAFINGLMVSADSKLDFSLVARKIGKRYRSFYGNAFTESSEPSNEEGIYGGLTFRMFQGVTLDMYADYFRFPWLKFRVDAPSSGREHLAQLTFKPDRSTLLYIRFRREHRQMNMSPISSGISPVLDSKRQSIRAQIEHKIDLSWSFRSRVEFNHIEEHGVSKHGYLGYGEAFYKAGKYPFSLNFRLMACETDSYDSRIYAFENDVRYFNIVPAHYDKFIRFYVNFAFDINPAVQFFFKLAKTISDGFSSTQFRVQTVIQW